MKIVSVFKMLLFNPIQFLERIISRVPWIVSDNIYVKLQYKARLGYFPNLENPVFFTEKLQWLKLYDHNPLYTKIVDKVLVKDYIANLIGKEHIIPTLHVWDDPSQIDFSILPNKFVLKCNHTGGGAVFICKDKSSFDISSVSKKLSKQLLMNTFLKTREWPYKNIPRKVFCEQYMEDESGELRDYKFYCFGGEPVMVLVATNRFTDHNFTYVDLNFKPIDIESAFGKTTNHKLVKPDNFTQMIKIARTLSRDFPHVRVDLYNIKGQIYFGELTFYDSSGFDDMNSDLWNKKLGDLIKLPQKRI